MSFSFNRVVFFNGPYMNKSILMYIMSYFGLFLFIIIQTTVTMNKVKTIDKVNLSMMIKSQGELNHTTVVDNINAFFCDTSFYYCNALVVFGSN